MCQAKAKAKLAKLCLLQNAHFLNARFIVLMRPNTMFIIESINVIHILTSKYILLLAFHTCVSSSAHLIRYMEDDSQAGQHCLHHN